MKRIFVVPEVVQEFLSGLSSPALDSVLFSVDYSATSLLPQNPDATRRILFFSKGAFAAAATPNAIEYNCYRQTLNGTTVNQITFARGI